VSGQLTPLTQADLPTIRAWRNHEQINAFMCAQHCISEVEHQQWFTQKEQDPLQYLYLYQENGVAQGFMQLQKISLESDVYRWGFYISPDASRGTGTKMTQQALKLAFDVLNAQKIAGEVLGFNHASRSLHNKLGFREEGCLKQHHYLNGQYHDLYCFGLLQSDYRVNKERGVLRVRASTDYD